MIELVVAKMNDVHSKIVMTLFIFLGLNRLKVVMKFTWGWL